MDFRLIVIACACEDSVASHRPAELAGQVHDGWAGAMVWLRATARYIKEGSGFGWKVAFGL